MTKTELIANMDEGADISKAKAALALTGFMDTVTSCLQDDDKMSLVGFGTFSTTKRAARTGRNPQTGKEIKIAARTVAKFKAGKKLVDAVK